MNQKKAASRERFEFTVPVRVSGETRNVSFAVVAVSQEKASAIAADVAAYLQRTREG